MQLCTDTHKHTSLIPDQWLWVLDSPETCCYWDAERLPMVGLSRDCAPLLHSSLRSSVCQYPENATLELCLTRGLSNLAWCEHLHKHRCVCECVRASVLPVSLPSLCMYLWLRACGCRGYFSAHILLLVFLISKSGPWSSLCRDGRFPLCKCHQTPLPVSPLSAPCCPLWHLWDRPCPFSDKEPWWLHTHTRRYLMAKRNTEETLNKNTHRQTKT